MATVTEKWSGRGWAVTGDGYEAERAFDVSDVADETEAVAAVSASMGVFVGSLHPFLPGGGLFCRDVRARRIGPTFYEVTARYTPRAYEGGDLLDRAPRYSWAIEIEHIETDVDEDGRLICNSAGYPIRPKPTKERVVWILQVRRWEPFYNPAVAELYIGSVNSAAGYLGPFYVDEGQMLCRSILPIGEYTATATPIEILYVFAIVRTEKYPWDWDYADMGTTGNGPNGPAQFVNSKGKEIAEPTLLDGAGLPINSTVKLDNGTEAPDTPEAPATEFAAWATEPVPSTGTPRAYTRVFRKRWAANFATLQL